MICEPCRDNKHLRCREWRNRDGATWCDCQHAPRGTSINWNLIRKPDAQVADPTTKTVDCLP
jgi:hypothetical protein